MVDPVANPVTGSIASAAAGSAGTAVSSEARMQVREAHCNSVDELVALFETSLDRGLATQVAQDRLLELGANELVKEERASPIALFFAQFKNTLIVILLVATVLSAALGEIVDAAIIAAIVLFCAVLSFVQEYRADNALNALKKMLAPMVRVLRDGIETRIPSRELVPGDVMLLEAGDRVAADARLAEIHSLKCDEAPLTGESFPVEKSLTPPPPGAAVGDRRNVVFAGTTVTYGRGKAIVTSHGMATEFGRIAEQVADVAAEPSPLEKRTAEVGRWLGLIALVVCAVTIVVSVVRAWMGNELNLELVLTMTMFAIALAVAAVPEALAAIVTGALAVGMHEMAKRNALVRRMPAVETLGCTTVICSDKTGTLTKGEMTARRVFVGGRSIEIGGAGYDPAGSFDPPLRPDDGAAQLMLAGGLLCSDATLGNDSGRWSVKGDPTEGALIVLAAKAGIEASGTRTSAPRVAEFPFSSERKRMTTVHRMPDGRHLAFVKGAPEVLLERCAAAQADDGPKPLTDSTRTEVLAASEAMAKDALRVLALAYKEVKDDGGFENEADVERDLTFLGLIGMMDPPRDEAREAVRTCREVHIRPVMITGDHMYTAVAVAAEVGIYRRRRPRVDRRRARPNERRGIRAGRRQGDRVRARVADGQAQDRARVEKSRRDRRDDRRRRQRCARAEARGHRHRDGLERDRRREGGRRHGARRRQFRDDRAGDRARPLDLRQHQEVPDLPPARQHHRSRRARGRRHRRGPGAPAAPARGDPLHQPCHRRPAGAGAGAFPAGPRHHAAAAAGSGRKYLLARRPPPRAARRAHRVPDLPVDLLRQPRRHRDRADEDLHAVRLRRADHCDVLPVAQVQSRPGAAAQVAAARDGVGSGTARRADPVRHRARNVRHPDALVVRSRHGARDQRPRRGRHRTDQGLLESHCGARCRTSRLATAIRHRREAP